MDCPTWSTCVLLIPAANSVRCTWTRWIASKCWWSRTTFHAEDSEWFEVQILDPKWRAHMFGMAYLWRDEATIGCTMYTDQYKLIFLWKKISQFFVCKRSHFTKLSGINFGTFHVFSWWVSSVVCFDGAHRTTNNIGSWRVTLLMSPHPWARCSLSWCDRIMWPLPRMGVMDGKKNLNNPQNPNANYCFYLYFVSAASFWFWQIPKRNASSIISNQAWNLQHCAPTRCCNTLFLAASC